MELGRSRRTLLMMMLMLRPPAAQRGSATGSWKTRGIERSAQHPLERAGERRRFARLSTEGACGRCRLCRSRRRSFKVIYADDVPMKGLPDSTPDYERLLAAATPVFDAIRDVPAIKGSLNGPQARRLLAEHRMPAGADCLRSAANDHSIPCFFPETGRFS